MSISVTFTNGKGSLSHNNRKFSASNVKSEFSKNNIILKQKDLKEAYQEIFNESCKLNNERQKRADRKLSPKDYLEKIERGRNKENNPKPFYESIVQVGNMYDFGIERHPEDAEKAKKILKEYFQDFECNNPNIHVFNATIHMDEQTPHMHIDWIPTADGYKTGMPKRNSLEKALEQQGVKANGKIDKRNNNRAVWQEREANRLIEVCKKYGIEASFNRHEKAEKTLSIDDFKKISQISERKAKALSKNIERMGYIELIRKGKKEVLESITEAKNAKIHAEKAEIAATLELKKKEFELGLRERNIEKAEQPMLDLQSKLQFAEMRIRNYEKQHQNDLSEQFKQKEENKKTIEVLKEAVKKTAERAAIFEAITNQQVLVLKQYPVNPAFSDVINKEIENAKKIIPEVIEKRYIDPKVTEMRERINSEISSETMKREHSKSLQKKSKRRDGMER